MTNIERICTYCTNKARTFRVVKKELTKAIIEPVCDDHWQ